MITHKHIISVCFVLSLLAACKGKDEAVKEYPKKIVGRWVLQKQTVVKNAAATKNDTGNDTIVIDETQYYKEFSFKPAEIEYGAEGGYLLVIKNYNDEIKLRRPGLWAFEKDTLVYMTLDSTLSDKFAAIVTDSILTLKQKIDYDDDGVMNDLYEGVYKRIIR